MANLNEFAARIRRIGVLVEKNSEKAVVLTALAVDQAVVLATPVDTGRARSNWVVSVGRPVLAAIEPYAPGKKLGIGETANARAALEQGRAALAAPGEKSRVYITNNVQYIGMLNDGHSTQAPAGFVENAVDAARTAIANMKLTEG